MKKIALFGLLFSFQTHAQVDGANIFGTDQVIKVELTFNQVNFWDSLVAYYGTETTLLGDAVITDNLGMHTFPSVAVNLKGNSSYGHPGNKKSFKIDFNDYVVGQNYDGLKKLNFNNSFKDPSFMREKLFFDVCIASGVPAPRVNYADVFINGTHWGFYILVEQVDDELLDWAIDEDTGNLFKAGDNFGGSNTPADLKYYGASATDYTGRYELKTNELANDWSDLIELLSYINTSTDAVFESEFATRFKENDLLRSIALDNVFSSLDSYLNSARNYYVYHNMLTNEWEWIKWDGNEAFGLYTGGPGIGNLTQLAPDYIAADRPLFTRIFENQQLYAEYLMEICWVLDQYFYSGYMDTRADEIKNLIASFVYADANKQYTDAQFNQNIETDILVSGGPMGSQTVFGIKSFVSARNSYLSANIDCSALELPEEKNELLVYPNPFDQSFTVSGIPADGTLAVYDMSGRMLYDQNTGVQSELTLDLPLVSGVYILQLSIGDQRYTYQIVKN